LKEGANVEIVPNEEEEEFIKMAQSEPEKSEVVEMESKLNISNLKAFTLNSAFEQIGGFGRFQMFAVLILAIVRNFGMLNVYLYGLNTDPVAYQCKTGNATEFGDCSAEYICKMRKDNATGFMF